MFFCLLRFATFTKNRLQIRRSKNPGDSSRDLLIPKRWRSLKLLKGLLNHPKKVTKNCQDCCFFLFLFLVVPSLPDPLPVLMWMFLHLFDIFAGLYYHTVIPLVFGSLHHHSGCPHLSGLSRREDQRILMESRGERLRGGSIASG